MPPNSTQTCERPGSLSQSPGLSQYSTGAPLVRHTLAGPVARANNPGWFWAAGANTARPVVSGGLGARPSGFLLEAPA